MAATETALRFDPLTEKDRQRIARFVESNIGVQCPASKHSLVESRLRKRQKALGFSSLKHYIDFALEAQEGEQERIHLLDTLTTNKTDFYREIEHFHFLRRSLEARLAASHSRAAVRFWSAGCSTGQEPYTLAMEILEMQQRFSHFRAEILATDISVSCLQTAKRAIYPHETVEPVPLAVRKKYLLRSNKSGRDLVQMDAPVRKLVQFQTLNLLHDDFRKNGTFDYIFCRNVMIYFSNSDRESIIKRFAASLKPGGILFIGHSENLVGNKLEFSRVQPTVYQRS